MILLSTVYITAIYPFVPGISSGPVLFFSMGTLLSLKGASLGKAACRLRLPATIVFFTLWVPLIPMAGYRTAEGNYLYPFFIVAGVTSIIGWIAWLTNRKEARLNGKLTNNVLDFLSRHEADVFFIFAAHNLLLPYVQSALMKACALTTGSVSAKTVAFANAYPLMLIICYLLTFIIVISICIFISQIVINRFPRAKRLLTGR